MRRCVAHSTVTGKLRRLSANGLVSATKEVDGFTYYQLTPIGLSALVVHGRIRFENILAYLEDDQKLFQEIIISLQPNLIERQIRIVEYNEKTVPAVPATNVGIIYLKREFTLIQSKLPYKKWESASQKNIKYKIVNIKAKMKPRIFDM